MGEKGKIGNFMSGGVRVPDVDYSEIAAGEVHSRLNQLKMQAKHGNAEERKRALQELRGQPTSLVGDYSARSDRPFTENDVIRLGMQENEREHAQAQADIQEQILQAEMGRKYNQEGKGQIKSCLIVAAVGTIGAGITACWVAQQLANAWK